MYIRANHVPTTVLGAEATAINETRLGTPGAYIPPRKERVKNKHTQNTQGMLQRKFSVITPILSFQIPKMRSTCVWCTDIGWGEPAVANSWPALMKNYLKDRTWDG